MDRSIFMLLFCFVVMGIGTYLIGIEWGRDRPDGMRIGRL